MASAVMTPLTADDEMRKESRNGRPMDHVAASFIAPNSRLTSFERLEIYNRQYWYRVLNALGEDFPALRTVIGSRAFDAMSVAYIDAHPNRSFTLRNLGSRLPEFLVANPHFAGRRADLAVDVARIEWAFVEAFDSAEREPLTLEQIATLEGDSHLALQPHLQLVEVEYPVDDLVLKLHKGEERQTTEAGIKHDEDENAPAKLPVLRRKPTWLAAHRVDYSVFYLRLKRGEFHTLRAIRAGQPLAEAIEAGVTTARVPAARRPQLVRQWFTTWAELGWICAPDLDKLVRTA
ncbi:MAG: putative DNA-binding domain-containing protein [Acidobacteria bacterium]|nr:putative DNA-binding domain-containing protein [Acidobacteriota bacterium]